MLKVSHGSINKMIFTWNSRNASIDVVLSVGQHIVSIQDALGPPAVGRVDGTSVNMLHHVKVRGNVFKFSFQHYFKEKGIAKSPTTNIL